MLLLLTPPLPLPLRLPPLLLLPQSPPHNLLVLEHAALLPPLACGLPRPPPEAEVLEGGFEEGEEDEGEGEEQEGINERVEERAQQEASGD